MFVRICFVHSIGNCFSHKFWICVRLAVELRYGERDSLAIGVIVTIWNAVLFG